MEKSLLHSRYVGRKRAKRKKIMIGKNKQRYQQRTAIRRKKADRARKRKERKS